ncbi:MAG: dihydrolipoyl dehydrogenase [Elusimicrobiota bacterium]|jgi:dihydrolipoamide dehydrogenase
MKTADVLVIGAGPGGYVCAIRLAQLGKKVVLVEKDKVGGVCLNVGCIPSKALIHGAGIAHKARHAEAVGIMAPELSVDWSKTVAWKNAVVGGLTRGVSALLKANGVETLHGAARFTGPKEAFIEGANLKETVQFEHAVVLTGSRPVSLPGFEFDGSCILGATEALALSEPPESMAVIGGGVIGLELGTIFAKLGSKITVVEFMDQLLPGLEPDAVAPISRSLQKLGAQIHLRSKALRWFGKDGSTELTVQTPEGELTLETDCILLSVGRRPNSDGLGLEAAGVELDEKGFIRVNEQMRSSAANIYAAGDVAGPPYLAHKASREALLAAAAIAGRPVEPRGPIPWAVYTDPEAAGVGETEVQARGRGADVLIGKFPFAANGRAQTLREPDGFVKLVADRNDGRLLGATLVGPDASDLIGELALALRMKATLEDLANTVHPHPSLSEAIMEAAEAALGHAIHMLPARR